MVDVVLDLETFGVGPGSAVVSIGAVSLGGSDFYAVIDKPTGAVDVGAVRWWLEQAEDVRAAVKSGQPEAAVLSMFSTRLSRGRPSKCGSGQRFALTAQDAGYGRHQRAVRGMGSSRTAGLSLRRTGGLTPIASGQSPTGCSSITCVAPRPVYALRIWSWSRDERTCCAGSAPPPETPK